MPVAAGEFDLAVVEGIRLRLQSGLQLVGLAAQGVLQAAPVRVVDHAVIDAEALALQSRQPKRGYHQHVVHGVMDAAKEQALFACQTVGGERS